MLELPHDEDGSIGPPPRWTSTGMARSLFATGLAVVGACAGMVEFILTVVLAVLALIAAKFLLMFGKRLSADAASGRASPHSPRPRQR